MMGNHWRLVGDWSPIDRRTVADQTMFTKMSPTSLVFDAATNTSRRPNCSDNQSPTGRRSSTIICRPPKTSENHPQNSGCRRSARGCRCNSLTTNRRLVGDHRQTFADLWQPPATTQKSGCQRSATGCHYSVTMALDTTNLNLMILLKCLVCLAERCLYSSHMREKSLTQNRFFIY